MDNDETRHLSPPTSIPLADIRLLRCDIAAAINRQVSRVTPTPCATAPLLVLRQPGSPRRYVLLDGHVRYQILRQRGAPAAPCRVIEDIRHV